MGITYTIGLAGPIADFLRLKAPGEYKCAWHWRERFGLVVFLGRRRCGVMMGPGLWVALVDAEGGGMGFMLVVGLMCWFCVF